MTNGGGCLKKWHLTFGSSESGPGWIAVTFSENNQRKPLPGPPSMPLNYQPVSHDRDGPRLPRALHPTGVGKSLTWRAFRYSRSMSYGARHLGDARPQL